MEFRGHQLRLTMKAEGQSRTLILTRQGAAPDSANPILGEWVGSQEMDGRRLESHYLFYPGGKGLFLLPFLTKPGRFSIQGTTMRFELPNHTPATGEFRVESDTLRTPSPSEKPFRPLRSIDECQATSQK